MRFETVVKPELAQRWRAAGEWRDETFFQILEARAEAHPDREVFVDGEARITYGALKDKVERCAAFLRRIGIGRGDVVTIQLPNRIAFPIVFFALELIGAIANKVNPDFRVRELDYILRFSGSRAFVCPASFKGFDYVGMAHRLREAIPALTHVVVSGGDIDGGWNLEQGIAETPPLAPEDRVRMSADEIFRMAFTSGTTGNPKCVLHSFNSTLPAVRQINTDMAVTERDVQLVYLPVCLNWGYLCLLQAIVTGSRAVLLERFSAKAALELIERERVTYIATAPASIVAMLNEPDLAELRRVVPARRHHRRRVGCDRDHPRLPGAHAGAPDRALRHAGDGLSYLHALQRRSGQGQRHHRPRRLQHGAEDPRRGRSARWRAARSARSPRSGPACTLATTPMRRPTPRRSRRTAGSARATSAASSMRRATSRSSAGARRSSIAAARSSSRARWRRSSTRIPRSCTRPWSASPTRAWASATACASSRRPGRRVTLAEMVAHLKGEVADYKLPEELVIVEELPFTATGKLRRHVLAEQVAKGLAGGADRGRALSTVGGLRCRAGMAGSAVAWRLAAQASLPASRRTERRHCRE